MPDETIKRGPGLPPPIPGRAPLGPRQPRRTRFLFWALCFLFVFGILYLGDLAITRNAGQAQPSLVGHARLGVLLVCCALAALIGGISSHYHSRR